MAKRNISMCGAMVYNMRIHIPQANRHKNACVYMRVRAVKFIHIYISKKN
jgi:hypothetical protein